MIWILMIASLVVVAEAVSRVRSAVAELLIGTGTLLYLAVLPGWELSSEEAGVLTILFLALPPSPSWQQPYPLPEFVKDVTKLCKPLSGFFATSYHRRWQLMQARVLVYRRVVGPDSPTLRNGNLTERVMPCQNKK